MILIAAADINNGIGNGSDLLYDIPEDKHFFKEKTSGNTVIMGRKTYESLPVKPLPGRKNIILTKNSSFSAPGACVCTGTDELMPHIEDTPDDKIFVIGGEQIYRLLYNFCDTAYITKIYSQKPADRFLFDFEKSEDWYAADFSELKEYNGIKYRFFTYKRKMHHA